MVKIRSGDKDLTPFVVSLPCCLPPRRRSRVEDMDQNSTKQRRRTRSCDRVREVFASCALANGRRFPEDWRGGERAWVRRAGQEVGGGGAFHKRRWEWQTPGMHGKVVKSKQRSKGEKES